MEGFIFDAKGECGSPTAIWWTAFTGYWCGYNKGSRIWLTPVLKGCGYNANGTAGA